MSSHLFELLPGHDLAYNEIVRPARRWAFSYYYLHRWLPRLHPQQAMLIQVLRQACWQGGEPTGRCRLSNGALCRRLGWSESSHKTLLSELDRPLSDWFIRRRRSRKRHVVQGHAVEGAPRYRVIMDDPLTPDDQRALGRLLAAHAPRSAYHAAEILGELAELRSRELWALLDRDPDAEPDNEGPIPTRPATVTELTRRLWPDLWVEQPTASTLAPVAERLQLRITGAGYAHMELDYLLRRWLPELGIPASWLVIALRARCFHDARGGESRDHVTCRRAELERQLGIPSRSFRRLLRDERTLPFFHIAPPGASPDPTTPRDIPHRGPLTFHVAFPLLPIAPADRERYERLLLSPDSSTTGQPTRLEAASQPGSFGEAIHNRPADPARGGQPTRLEAADEPGSKRPVDPAERVAGGQSTRLEPASRPDYQESTESKKPQRREEQESPTSRSEGGDDRRRRLRELLLPFGIGGIERLLENEALTVAEARGWILRGREEVSEAQMGGYLFRRLAGREPAPPLPHRYRLAGAVEPDEICLFEQWWLDELAPPPFADAAQRARYGAWLEVTRGERGDPERPDYSPHARWRREMARASAAGERRLNPIPAPGSRE